MANWTNIKTTKYDGPYGSYAGLSVTLQYDKDADTPTSRTLRFRTSATGSGIDGYYILWAPNTSKEAVYKVKGYNESINNSSSFKVTKTYGDTNFNIPAYWLCHCGAVTPTSDRYMTFADAGKQTMYWYFTHNRKNFKTEVAASTSTGTRVTAIGKGTVSITDNGDNTFTLKGTKGASGTNNPASGPTLKWGYTSSYSSTFKNGDTKTLTIDDTSDATRTVYAKSITGATYGNDTTATTSLAVKQYVGPGKPGNLTVTSSKSKYTADSNWTLNWTAATAANKSSPVKGYRIRVFVNRKSIPFKNKSGEVLTTDNGDKTDNWRYYYDRDKTDTDMVFYASKNNLTAGDSVIFVIQGYTKNAKGVKVFGNSNTRVISDPYLVQSAGIVRTKVSGSWKEGQVYVKVSGAWKEAEAIYTKVNGTWKKAN